MLNNSTELNKLKSSILYYIAQDNEQLSNLLLKAEISSEIIGYDNWNGGIDTYQLNFTIPIELYKQTRNLHDYFEKEISELVDIFIGDNIGEQVSAIKIKPIMREYVNWIPLKTSKDELLENIETIKIIMIKVSTGVERIQNCENEYVQIYQNLDENFNAIGVKNPNPFKSLWDWYGRWSQPDLNTYRSRRKFVPELYETTIDLLKKSIEESFLGEPYTPTGWERVDRTIYEMRSRIAVAQTEEQYQAIGMLGRETLITIAQEVYNPQLHTPLDGIAPSETDAKRMLEAYLAYRLSGNSHERQRKFAKSAVDLANHLTHDRMATKQDAEICLLAVSTAVSLIKNLEMI